MIEEALKKMMKQMRELTPFGFGRRAEQGLGIQRKDFGFRHHEEALEGFTHE
jgi:hypothetical protein